MSVNWILTTNISYKTALASDISRTCVTWKDGNGKAPMFRE